LFATGIGAEQSRLSGHECGGGRRGDRLQKFTACRRVRDSFSMSL
jgi:hypothetical protein